MSRPDGRLPVGYAEVRSPAGRWIARHECADEIQRGAADSALRGPIDRRRGRGGGRGRLARLRLGGLDAVAKRARHGGILGPLLRGLYLGRRRILDQLASAGRLERAGVPTPAVLAVGWRNVLGPLQAHVIVTGAVPDAQNLYQAARENAPWRRRRIALEKSAGIIRDMHDAGFLHADLNVTNLLFGRGPEGDRVQIVDLDGGRFHQRLGRRARFRNLARLLRSYEKWIAGHFRLSGREEILFLRRYCRGDREMLRWLRRRLASSRARLGLRRIGRQAAGAPSGDRRPDGRATE